MVEPAANPQAPKVFDWANPADNVPSAPAAASSQVDWSIARANALRVPIPDAETRQLTEWQASCLLLDIFEVAPVAGSQEEQGYASLMNYPWHAVPHGAVTPQQGAPTTYEAHAPGPRDAGWASHFYGLTGQQQHQMVQTPPEWGVGVMRADRVIGSAKSAMLLGHRYITGTDNRRMQLLSERGAFGTIVASGACGNPDRTLTDYFLRRMVEASNFWGPGKIAASAICYRLVTYKTLDQQLKGDLPAQAFYGIFAVGPFCYQFTAWNVLSSYLHHMGKEFKDLLAATRLDFVYRLMVLIFDHKTFIEFNEPWYLLCHSMSTMFKTEFSMTQQPHAFFLGYCCESLYNNHRLPDEIPDGCKLNGRPIQVLKAIAQILHDAWQPQLREMPAEGLVGNAPARLPRIVEAMNDPDQFIPAQDVVIAGELDEAGNHAENPEEEAAAPGDGDDQF